MVMVLNRRNQPLMPCSCRKARRLLRQGKAVVAKKSPFAIRLTVATGETIQPVTVGLDSGYLNVGVSIIAGGKELHAEEVVLRSDIVGLNSERRQYRRNRRNRKSWYRQPRFLNRKKPEGWLAPSLQHKLDSQVKLVVGLARVVPVSKVVVEVASFDIQKIKNPEIEGVGYQLGDQAGFANVR
ncbi:MAG TPA: RNA-guided endonuclease IscB, partial [Candidatus Methylomirabilis sp.]|nr:RNA-guided endonuclease IscB [Candidatus Methylomirabilis sp.]